MRSRSQFWALGFAIILMSPFTHGSILSFLFHDDLESCGIYLAPSSIPNAGLGMYAGHRPFKKNDEVTYEDIVMPIFEFEWHNKGKKETQKFENFLWDEYTWNADVFPGAEEECEEVEYMQFASPGVGAAANSYLSLVNIEDNWVRLGLAMSTDSPGAGAQTPYYGRSYHAIDDIPAGGEIWVNYGENYFSSRPNVYGFLPLPQSYPKANSLLRMFERLRLRNLVKEERAILSSTFWDDLFNFLNDQSSVWKTSRILNAMPGTASSIPSLLQDGGTAYRDYNRSIKELSWLEENGQCMDNIKSGISEFPDVGRGAFANRFIPKGGLVAPAPVVHIPDYDVLKMYEPIDSPRNDKGHYSINPNMEGPLHYQLLLNYCFGHEESTLLLCPYGLLTALINHSSKNANTKLIWSDNMRHKEWLQKPIEDFGDDFISGLQLDFVATRHIKEGEEILIDYGVAWEEAWKAHLNNYVPRHNYIPAFELNRKLPDVELRTGKDRPYELDGIQLRCRSWYSSKFLNLEESDYPCQIRKKLDTDRFIVEVFSDESKMDHTYFERTGILWDVPSDAFFFVDLPYEREHHFQFDAFRHAMMMPDDLFPNTWKNLK